MSNHRTVREGRLRVGRFLPLVSAALVLAAGLLLLAAGGRPVALAQEPPLIEMQVEVGFDGKVRAGRWAPVVVELKNLGPDFEGELRVMGSGGAAGSLSSSLYVTDVVLPRGGHKEFTLYAFDPTFRTEVELVSKGKTVTSAEARVTRADDSQLFVGVVGDRAGGWNLLTTVDLFSAQGRDVEVAPIPLHRFPQRAEVLDAFDVITLGDTPAQSLPALEALEAWVAGGGLLVLPGGASAEANLKGLPEALTPVTLEGVVLVQRASSLEALGGEPLPAGSSLPAAKGQVKQGRVLAQEGDVPLAVLQSFGEGRVLFLAFDPSVQPLAGWAGLPQLWKELLIQSLPGYVVPTVVQPPYRVAPFGGPLNSNQWVYRIQNVVSNLPALELPSTNLLIGLIAGYILLVGPVNYIVLRRLRRAGWAWASIPALVLLFASSTYFLAAQSKGDDLQVNSVNIVQWMPGTQWARVRQMVGVFAPSEGDYHVEVSGGALLASSADLFSASFGGPGSYYSSRGNEPGVKIRHNKDRSEAELLNMGLWTMQSVWTSSMQHMGTGLAQDLHIEGDRLKGTVTNHTGQTLEEVWLVGGNLSVSLGRLGPGDSAQVDEQLSNASSGALYYSMQQALPYLSQPPGTAQDWRQRQRIQDTLLTVAEEYATYAQSGPAFLVLGWSEGTPDGVKVNQRPALGHSLTLFVQGVSLVLKGAFTIPGGLVAAHIVDASPSSIASGSLYGPGGFMLDQDGLTFQVELPQQSMEVARLAILVPFDGYPYISQNIEVSLYRWVDGTWENLDDLSSVSLTQPVMRSGPYPVRPVPGLAPPPGVIPTSIPTPAPPPPSSRVIVRGGAGTAMVVMTSPYRAMFSQALEAVVPKEAIGQYVSDSGLMRIKLASRSLTASMLGAPTLVLEGVAHEQ